MDTYHAYEEIKIPEKRCGTCMFCNSIGSPKHKCYGNTPPFKVNPDLGSCEHWGSREVGL